MASLAVYCNESSKIDSFGALSEPRRILTCTQTYRRWSDSIEPFPKNLEETIPAVQALCNYIIDPVIDQYGQTQFELTYGFCSSDLKRFLAQKDPLTGVAQKPTAQTSSLGKMPWSYKTQYICSKTEIN